MHTNIKLSFLMHYFISSIFILVLSVCVTLNLNGQSSTDDHERGSGGTGQWYVYWGWNGSHYTKSDIHFEGSDHEFTLHKVVAKDRQTKFTLKKYFHPEYFTTPQYNFRIGKYLKNNWDISLAIDHMKYVIRQGQSVNISGTISEEGSPFNGTYTDQSIDISLGFLQYEHTDGLNYVNLGLRKQSPLSKLEKKVHLDFIYGFGLGALIPKSDVTLLGRQRKDVFNLSGYGIDIISGLRLNLGKRWFIQSEIKTGYINLPSVHTTLEKASKASQNFAYVQYNILIGGNMLLKKDKRTD